MNVAMVISEGHRTMRSAEPTQGSAAQWVVDTVADVFGEGVALMNERETRRGLRGDIVDRATWRRIGVYRIA